MPAESTIAAAWVAANISLVAVIAGAIVFRSRVRHTDERRAPSIPREARRSR
ncbi:hypothetical protein [Microbacterium oleivorans]|uniref:hypothetical protein n=1 Tax=Microbacterium oleivorans TaxID=273677 RepID=UPI000AB970F8|nr:hypothetical protein [Microbacterium oleivorans]AZS44308.1 hypothetical protein BWL13_01895 [Microbacterium oleivorans]